MIELLVTVIFFCIIAGLAWWLIGMLPIAAPFKQVIQVAFILICLLILVGIWLGEVPVYRFRH